MKTTKEFVIKFKKYIFRIVALFIYTALDAIGGASLIGQKAATGAGIAGIIAIAKVSKDLAKAYMDDGVITDKEMDSAIKDASSK